MLGAHEMESRGSACECSRGEETQEKRLGGRGGRGSGGLKERGRLRSGSVMGGRGPDWGSQQRGGWAPHRASEPEEPCEYEREKKCRGPTQGPGGVGVARRDFLRLRECAGVRAGQEEKRRGRTVEVGGGVDGWRWRGGEKGGERRPWSGGKGRGSQGTYSYGAWGCVAWAPGRGYSSTVSPVPTVGCRHCSHCSCGLMG